MEEEERKRCARCKSERLLSDYAEKFNSDELKATCEICLKRQREKQYARRRNMGVKERPPPKKCDEIAEMLGQSKKYMEMLRKPWPSIKTNS